MNLLANRPRIAITMGDPAGIGPELCARLLSDHHRVSDCIPIVFGDAALMRRAAAASGVDFHCDVIDFDQTASLSQVTEPCIFQATAVGLLDVHPGQVSAVTGQASFDFLQAAMDCQQSGLIQGVTTGPINKAAWKAAGINYPGHTELFAERFGSDRFCMMMTAPEFSCSLVTTHVGYREVPDLITTDRILEVIQLTASALTRTLGRKPNLAVLGLNPHAGEHGLFGNGEEERLIFPAIEAARTAGFKITGPLPPDTAWLPELRESIDGYICMYHDQGLIPFKAFNFDSGVNVTLGLPVVRTSVDHGTALNIAWQGVADESSLIAAVQLATRLAS